MLAFKRSCFHKALGPLILEFFGLQIRFNVQIKMVLRLNALFKIYILPENTGPYCNYKIICGGGRGLEPPKPPSSGDALVYCFNILHSFPANISSRCTLFFELFSNSVYDGSRTKRFVKASKPGLVKILLCYIGSLVISLNFEQFQSVHLYFWLFITKGNIFFKKKLD